MRTGVYICLCGGILSELIDGEALCDRFVKTSISGYVKLVELACSADGVEWIAEDLKNNKPDRVVIAACSPRDHEETFRAMMQSAQINPFLLQMVNIREHVGWVTPDKEAATKKAWQQIFAAISRVALHEPLERQYLDVCTDVLVIGGGPAGLKASLTLAGAGRNVVLVEKSPILGGMPLRYQEVFPNMECGSCVLAPFISETISGNEAARIERFFMSELMEVKGSFGNFEVKIKRYPRYVDIDKCIGCGQCIPACPVSYPNDFNFGMNERKALDFYYFGGLPNVPYIDNEQCVRFTKGDSCVLCKDACPVDGIFDFEATINIEERKVGAIILAVGGSLYQMKNIPSLGYGLPGVVTSLECERMFSSNGPTEGLPCLQDGSTPKNFAIIHCAGSLCEQHKDYCSGICCLDAFKINVMAEHVIEGSRVTHYIKTLCLPGKDDTKLYRKAMFREGVRQINFTSIDDIQVKTGEDGRPSILFNGESNAFDLVVLMPPVVPSKSVASLSKIMDLPLDRNGFFDEMHGRVDVTSSKLRGVYIAGSCQGPMHLGQAISQGLSAAGSALSALVPGRQLELEAVYATVEESRCSGCRACIGVCPYKAISFESRKEVAAINPALCVGCGTCVATCPASAIKGRHFSTEQIFAEIEGILQ